MSQCMLCRYARTGRVGLARASHWLAIGQRPYMPRNC